jgi:hypothetical protein
MIDIQGILRESCTLEIIKLLINRLVTHIEMRIGAINE